MRMSIVFKHLVHFEPTRAILGQLYGESSVESIFLN
jgi:hypothetical protein